MKVVLERMYIEESKKLAYAEAYVSSSPNMLEIHLKLM